MTRTTPTLLKPILIAGLIAGALDITYACVFSYIRRGVSPAVVLRSVAAGALGPTARDGGMKVALLGLFFHFLIAFIAAAVYVIASRGISFMNAHAVMSGILFGLCVYVVMNCVVLRVSAIHQTLWPWQYAKSALIGGLLIHMFGIGLPIALVARRYSK
jgi:uncharacterized membrane protein YagU involved in acid resistance